MLKFKDLFYESRRTLSIRNLDLSSNHLNDEAGCILIDAIYHQDTIENLNLRNNLVKDRTARAIAFYVAKRGKCLKKVDLTMNKGIPVTILEDIRVCMGRNAERAEKIKGYFMNLFKRICAKYDMNEEFQ
jgi:hypothetical protein